MTLEVWEAVQGALARGALDATELAALAGGRRPAAGSPARRARPAKDLSRLHLTLAHQAACSARPRTRPLPKPSWTAPTRSVRSPSDTQGQPMARKETRRLAPTAASAPSHTAARLGRAMPP